jgi:hypothetical protein
VGDVGKRDTLHHIWKEPRGYACVLVLSAAHKTLWKCSMKGDARAIQYLNKALKGLCQSMGLQNDLQTVCGLQDRRRLAFTG